MRDNVEEVTRLNLGSPFFVSKIDVAATEAAPALRSKTSGRHARAFTCADRTHTDT
jgi:hypothetical protein